MTTKPSRAAWLCLALSLLPLLLVALVGLYMRPKFDDFAVLAQVRQYNDGPGAALYYFNNWSGSYTRWFIVGAFSPLAWRAASAAPAAIILAWFAGASWLVYESLSALGVERTRKPLALSLGALLVFAWIHGFLSWRSLYWYVAGTAYSLPYACLCALFAYTLRVARQPSRPRSGMLVCGAIAFVSAGLSEGAAIFQVTLMPPLFILTRAGVQEPLRSRLSHLLVAGWLGSIASLAIQYASPGTALRRADIDASQAALPIRDLGELLRRAVEESFALLASADTVAGVALMILVGLGSALLIFDVKRVRETGPPRLHRQMLWLGLLLQVICLPVLSAYVSNDTQIFGRYSPRYFAFVVLNMGAIAAFGLLLWQGRRIDRWLSAPGGRKSVLFQALLIAASMALLFEIPLLRIWVWHYTLLTLICFALPFVVGSPPYSLLRHGALILPLGMLIAWICQASLVAALLVARGIVFHRVLTAAPIILVITGLCFGMFLGQWIRAIGVIRDERRRIWAAIALAAALCLGALMFRGQLERLAVFQTFARQWDINHASILDQRERGVSPIVVDAMPTAFGSYIEDKYAIAYYGAPVEIRGG